jgi:hypothetical protein
MFIRPSLGRDTERHALDIGGDQEAVSHLHLIEGPSLWDGNVFLDCWFHAAILSSGFIIALRFSLVRCWRSA